MRSTVRPETLVGAIGGLGAGYLLWLLAISIGEDTATASVWSLTVLAVSAAVGVIAALWGLWQRRRRRYGLAALAFGLPVLPLVLTLAVLADLYL